MIVCLDLSFIVIDIKCLWFFSKIVADENDDTTVESLDVETATKVQSKEMPKHRSYARLPPLQSRDLYENVMIAVEGKPIPIDFVALSPLYCSL